jgi:hypothetical protein
MSDSIPFSLKAGLLATTPEPLDLPSGYVKVQSLRGFLLKVFKCFQGLSQPHLVLCKLLKET